MNIASIETFNNRLRLSQETFDDGYNLEVVDLTPALNNNSMKLSEMTIELSEQEQKFIDIFETVKDLDKTFEKFGFRRSTMSQLKDFAKTFQPLVEGAGAVGDFFARQGEGILQAGGASGQRALQVGKEFATKGVEAGIMALVLSNEKVQEALGKVFDALFELIDPIIDLLAPVIESLVEILVELKPLFELLIPVIRETMVPMKGLIHVMKQVIGPIVHLVTEIAKIFTPMTSLTEAINALAHPLNELKKVIDNLASTFSVGGGGSSSVVGSVVGAVTGAVGSVASALGFADGGRVRGNRSIIVGEEGPEVFTPNQNGTIIPNHDLGGQTVVNVFLDMEGQVKLPLHQYISSVQRRAERSGNPQLAGILAG
jgi:phage-related protein